MTATPVFPAPVSTTFCTRRSSPAEVTQYSRGRSSVGALEPDVSGLDSVAEVDATAAGDLTSASALVPA